MTNETLKNNPHVSQEALREIHDDLLSWAYSLVGDQAEDVLQQSYVLVLEGKALYGQQSTLKTWMFGVVKNVSRRVRRSAMLRLKRDQRWISEAAQDDEHHQHTVEADRSSPAVQKGVSLAIRTLPARQREVLELHTYREFSLEECAYIMRTSVGTTRAHYHRAKVTLRKHLEEYT